MFTVPPGEGKDSVFPQDGQDLCYQCKDSYVHHWITSIHRENSKTRQDTHKTFSVASQNSLDISNATKFSDSENDTTWGMMVKPSQFLHPWEQDVWMFTDASNTGWGAHLKQDSTGGLWSQKEKSLHISGDPGPETIHTPMQLDTSTNSLR